MIGGDFIDGREVVDTAQFKGAKIRVSPPPRNAELQDTDGGIDQLFSIDKDNGVAGNDKIFGGNGKEIFKAGHGNGCDIIEGFIDEQDLIFSGVNSLEASSDNSDNDSLIIR